MHCISKHFTTDGYNQIVLERDDWTDEQFQTFMDIFGLTEAEKIVITDYKIEAYTKPMPTEEEWEKAINYLNQLIADYAGQGWTGQFALQGLLLPMKKLYDDGNRSRDLYEDIMECE